MQISPAAHMHGQMQGNPGIIFFRGMNSLKWVGMTCRSVCIFHVVSRTLLCLHSAPGPTVSSCTGGMGMDGKQHSMKPSKA